jgi:hypothetical protein
MKMNLKRFLIGSVFLLSSVILANARLGLSKAECDTLYKQEGQSFESSLAPGMALRYHVGNVMVVVMLKDDKCVGVFYTKFPDDAGKDTFSSAEYMVLLEKNGVIPTDLHEVKVDDSISNYWKHDTDDLEFSDSHGIHIFRKAAVLTNTIFIWTKEGHDFVWDYLKSKATKATEGL